MTEDAWRELSARERQIMGVLYRRGRATVAEIRAGLPEPPTASAVRTMLLRLEEKGQVRRDRSGARNVYTPARPREAVRSSMLERVVETFFDGSPVKAMAAILDRSAAELPEEELERLAALVEEARRRDS